MVEENLVPECGELAAALIADAAGIRWGRQGGGFASQAGCQHPGGHSLKLGTPGLYYAAPLGLV